MVFKDDPKAQEMAGQARHDSEGERKNSRFGFLCIFAMIDFNIKDHLIP